MVICLALVAMLVLVSARSSGRVASVLRTAGLGQSLPRFGLRALQSKAGGGDWPVSKVRSQFIDYYIDKRQHVNFKSSPVVPVNDPTLLFANAGMNQFKPVFVGTADPTSPLSSLKRAVNSQKCIRAGGKHNDLDDVGKDTYHHTFFEMLGTWSFGDYFKKESIDWAWDLLVNVYKLPEDRFYASYFGGDEALGLECDTEARDLWLQYLPAERVLPFDKYDNFWEMGDTGPCGPCSEIHFDRIGGRDAASLVNMDDPDVIEIWNHVFIQYNRLENGELRNLPEKHIDTGMGLERITSILQEKTSNYDTNVFTPIFDEIQSIVGCEPYTGKLGAEDAAQNHKDMAYRVIADHIRTLSFSIADGAVPSNEGRGYVLRRILRRAVRYGIQTLGAQPGFFSKLVGVVVDEFGDTFPELKTKKDWIIETLEDEERSFSSLLDRGVKYFAEMEEELKLSRNTIISGQRAFYMYDTLGFPVDLTSLMAEEKGLKVDVPGFEIAMKEQKDRSRLAQQTKRLAGRTALKFAAEQTSYLQNSGVKPTDDVSKYQMDVEIDTKIKAIYSPEGQFIKDVAIGMDAIGIVLESSPFYAEAGGQVPDIGTISFRTPENELKTLDVIDVQTYAGFLLHTCVAKDDNQDMKGLSVDSEIKANVDYTRRRKVAPNHTMTHVLNFALRKVVGDDVDQKGSQVSDEKFRFDFNSKKGLTATQVKDVEKIINDIIDKEVDVNNEVVPLTDAMAIKGLRAVFGETYPDPVRVVSVGPSVSALLSSPDSTEWINSSIEFCGGTHLSNTREAVACCIIEETAVAKGIRRISGITGPKAKIAIERAAYLEEEVLQLSTKLQSKPDLLALENKAISLRAILDEAVISQGTKSDLRCSLEVIAKTIISKKNEEMMSTVDNALNDVKKEVEAKSKLGEKFIVLSMKLGSDGKSIKRAIEEIKKVDTEMSFIGISEDTSKLTVFAIVSDEGQKNGAKANDWVSAALAPCGGRGGGKSSNAQGSASDPTKLSIIIDTAQKYLTELNISK